MRKSILMPIVGVCLVSLLGCIPERSEEELRSIVQSEILSAMAAGREATVGEVQSLRDLVTALEAEIDILRQQLDEKDGQISELQAVLSTGLLSTEKSKETVIGGLEETAASIALRGDVIGHQSSTAKTRITRITFQVSNASQTGDPVALTENDTIVSYIDTDQVVNEFTFNPAGTTSTDVFVGAWSPNWISGTGPLLDSGERVEITVNLDGLTQDGGLGTSEEFTIQVKPAAGAVLTVTRTVPAELTAVIDLNGPLSSGGSKETLLEETAASISLRSSVIAHRSATTTTKIGLVTFQVSNASQAGDPVALTESDAIVSYIDQDQTVSVFAFDTEGTVSASVGSGRWSPNWISGTGPLFNAGERVEITVNLDGLVTDLDASSEFTIQVKLATGAVLTVTRTLPAELTAVTDLQ